MLRDERGSPDFMVAKLWVLVNVSPPTDHSRFDRGGGGIQPLVDWARRRSDDLSPERALWSGPDQRAHAAGTGRSKDVSAVEPNGRRGLRQERASCLLGMA
jgi:hypothetical protein